MALKSLRGRPTNMAPTKTQKSLRIWKYDTFGGKSDFADVIPGWLPRWGADDPGSPESTMLCSLVKKKGKQEVKDRERHEVPCCCLDRRKRPQAEE